MSGKQPMFSIIVVSLNPGEKLVRTMESIFRQTCTDYEVVVKDGGSKDGSLDALRAFLQKNPSDASRVHILEQPDKSIYDGMNQAVAAAAGKYFYFLNCGDYFAEPGSLKEAGEAIRRQRDMGSVSLLYYGNIYDALRGQVVSSNPRIDAFACYRNVPCHQACIYDRTLFSERGYETKYRVRADYEHFLWCFFMGNANPRYIPVTLASYEGGGFSETSENRARSKAEHREITALYMNKAELFRYRLILAVTLAPLRTKLAESPVFAGVYNRLKKLVYQR